MRYLIIVSLVTLASIKVVGQNTLIDRNGTSHFFSEAPLENIEATNKQVIGAIDLKKGEVAVSMSIKDFHFEKSLMEEHFNENYMESDKFPKATFKGAIEGFESLDFTKQGKFTANANGEILIHGVTKPLKALVSFNISGNQLTAETKFDLSVAEFDVDIPKVVIMNIAEVVNVTSTFKFNLQP